jgi:hypothetical protein
LGATIDDAKLRGLGDGIIAAGAQPGGDVGGELGEGLADQGHWARTSYRHHRPSWLPGRAPRRLGSNEQIFGVNEQIPGRG